MTSRVDFGLRALLVLLVLTAALGLAGPVAPPFVAALSLWPSLAAAILTLSFLLFFRGNLFFAGAGLCAASALLAGLAPHYRGNGQVAEPELRLVWANLLKRPEALERAVAFAEAEGAEVVVLGEYPDGTHFPPQWSVRCAVRPVIVLTRTPGEPCVGFNPANPVARELFPACRGQAPLACRSDAPFRRPMRLLTLSMGEERIDLIGVHLSMPLVPGYTADRSRQLSVFGGVSPRRPTLIVGDFNAVPWDPALAPLTRAGFTRVPIGAKTTWATPLLVAGLPIDHAFVTAGLEASAEVGPFTGSDHRPLLVKMKLRKEPSHRREF